MSTKVKRFVSTILLVIMSILLLAGCGKAAKLTEYDFGVDKIPSVNAVLGETRKVSGISAGIENGVRHREYTYATETMADDLWVYYTRLSELGWIVTKDFSLADGEGEMQLGIESADEGKILIISIEFTLKSYTIRVEKMDGTLTLY